MGFARGFSVPNQRDLAGDVIGGDQSGLVRRRPRIGFRLTAFSDLC